MRDINRIEPFLEKLKLHWLKNPDIRFGQLIFNLVSGTRKSMYNMEENEWLKIIQSEIDKKIIKNKEK